MQTKTASITIPFPGSLPTFRSGRNPTTGRNHRRRMGFSLLELLAVISILAVLAAALLPRISVSGKTAKERLREFHTADLNKALERYYMERGQFATSLQDLEAEGFYPEGVPVDPVDGSSYSIDAATKRIVKK